MTLNTEEIQNLSNLLLSNDLEKLSLGLDLIEANQDFGKELVIQLILLRELSKEEEIAMRAHIITQDLITLKEDRRLKEGMGIFSFLEKEETVGMDQFDKTLTLHLRKFEKIQTEVGPLIAKSNLFIDRYFDLAQNLIRLNQTEKGIEMLEMIVDNQAQYFEAQYLLGTLYLSVHQEYESAKFCFNQAIEACPEHVESLKALADIQLLHYNKPVDAISILEKIIEFAPDSVSTYNKLTHIHFQHLKDFDRCRQLIDIVMSMDTYNAQALKYLSLIQWKEDQKLYDAVRTLQTGIEHHEGSDLALLSSTLGQLYAEGLQNFELARNFYLDALEATPGDRNIFEKMRYLLANYFNDFGTINLYFIKYLEAKPNDASMHFEYAKFIQSFVHNKDEVKKQLRLALKLNPGYPEATTLLKNL